MITGIFLHPGMCFVSSWWNMCQARAWKFGTVEKYLIYGSKERGFNSHRNSKLKYKKTKLAWVQSQLPQTLKKIKKLKLTWVQSQQPQTNKKMNPKPARTWTYAPLNWYLDKTDQLHEKGNELEISTLNFKQTYNESWCSDYSLLYTTWKIVAGVRMLKLNMRKP